MEYIIQTILIFLHALVAWFFIEGFFNRFHNLDRKAFVFWHYVVVFVAFFGIFLVFAAFFSTMSPLVTTVIAFCSILIIEFIVFRLLYSGEVWFFNIVDWVIPLFIAVLAVFVAGIIAR